MPESSSRPIRILVVDDHPILREGVAAILEDRDDMLLVGEARDGVEAIVQFRDLRPDVTLMDLQMPGMGGVEAIKAIRAEHPTACIVVLTTYDGDVQAVRALKAGAMGYLLKSSLRTEMLDAIHSVSQGRRYLHRNIADEIAMHILEDGLSEREVTVLQLVAVGKANKEIARDLGISEETVKGYLKGVFTKLGVSDRTHAVTVAARRGIIEL
ncbi:MULTISPECIES: response regulator [Caulobacter]|uniref:DNA-binding NarL/FixJ family response regulator n=1 Tax=Caulobacter rhizosphaerae TaxID=2010972 RepID=A0ABU1MZ10_9CAUL|nr:MULTISPECIES: response regulator transcription factor [Caulobacter]KQZ30080.1 LuxR family transcriptional regulator [Caulobacter sp. Root1472]MDR6531146.1 DNA-binding NarL/FixJ family response regulator [Caulobacter rhizosphaerae]GGL26446.1 DNA-binding response regulator [Caulobacter rhizosphaerae]